MAFDVDYDISRAILVCYGKEDKNYSKIYPKTNEKLSSLFQNFEVSGKDVFTVLASSDQLFSARYLKARSVDTFDQNQLTFYYYYLRSFLMRELGLEYPTDEFCRAFDNRIWNFLENVVPQDEKEEQAKKFWLGYLAGTNGLPNRYLFYITSAFHPNIYHNHLSSVLKGDFTFFHIDFFDEVEIDKKYDVLLLSNILEYTSTFSDYQTVASNILKLLREDGICVCSYYMNDHDSWEHLREAKIFYQLGLEAEDFSSTYRDSMGMVRDIGYVYRKRK